MFKGVCQKVRTVSLLQNCEAIWNKQMKDYHQR